jgi:hypothetical protein
VFIIFMSVYLQINFGNGYIHGFIIILSWQHQVIFVQGCQ